MSYSSKHPGADIEAILDSVENKQDKITDLETIRAGAAKGATALQTEQYKGTITEVKMNGASKGTSGVVDLGTVITEHQDISGKADKNSLSTVATSGSYNDLKDKPTIPSAVTESTVRGWGFTKNTGTYSKPSTGIPKSDLASDVQTSLGKADTAIQNENYPVVSIDASTTSVTMNPNTYYKRASSGSALTVSLASPSKADIQNEYVLEIECSAAITLTLPNTIKWANETAPEIAAGKTYVISVVNNLAVFAEF